MIRVSEATFGRQVLRAALPALVCFGTRGCPGRRALAPALERAAVAHRGRLLVATALLDDTPLLAELHGVVASPTLMVFRHGERQGQVVGFLPSGLVAMLAAEAAGGGVEGDAMWSPVEERFEDAVLIPLLQGWGLTVQRQVGCVLAGGATSQRGRIDLLVAERAGGPPLTLVESKRHIAGAQDLRQAAAQAAGYARSLGLPSFVVAAPRGLWIYRLDGERSRCALHLTGLELHQAPEQARRLLLELRPAPPGP